MHGGSKMISNMMLVWTMAAVTEDAGGGLSGVETVICSPTTMSTSQLQGLGGLQVHACVWGHVCSSRVVGAVLQAQNWGGCVWAMRPHGVLEILSKYGMLPLWGQCHQLSSVRELTAIVVTPVACLMNAGGGV